MADIRTAPQLDDFNRADENPLSAGGLYRALGGDGAVVQMQNLANRGEGAATGANVHCISCYQTLVQTGGFEMWMVVGGAADNNNAWALSWLDDITSSPDSYSGYMYERYRALGPDGWRIFRFDNVSATQIAGGTGIDSPASGDLILFRAVGTELEGWRSTDGGANWTATGSVTDNTYRTDLIPCIGVRASATQQPNWQSWGAGRYPPRNVQLPYLGVGP